MPLWWDWETHKRDRELEAVFAGRPRLDDDEFYEHYFRQHGVDRRIAVRVRQVLAKVLDADLSRIADADDFSAELSLFWRQDSLADVEVFIALEEEFGVSFTEANAANIKSSLKDLVLAIEQQLRDKKRG